MRYLHYSKCFGWATSYGIYTYNKAIDYAVENDYEFYYNGTHVDKDKLNIDDYTVTVNNEKPCKCYPKDIVKHSKYGWILNDKKSPLLRAAEKGRGI